MQYSIPYILLVCVFGVAAIYHDYANDETSKHRTDVFCVLVFVFFFGLRGYVFDDWINYAEIFRKIDLQHIGMTIEKSTVEPGFLLLNALCKSIIDNYHVFVMACTLLNLWLMLRFFSRYVQNLPLALMCYVCMGGLIISINLMRNSIAIFLFLNVIHLIQERKAWPYFGVCLLAMTFHYSAIVYFPLYFFLHRRLNKWVYLVIFLGANIILLMHISLLHYLVDIIAGSISKGLQMHIDAYMERATNEGFRISIGYLERLFTGLLVFFFMDKLYERRQENRLFVNSILLYYMMFFLFSEFDEVSIRMSYLFVVSYWIIWPELVSCFTIENNRRLFSAFLYIYCIMKIIGSTNFITAKYDNLLFGIDSYQERLYIHNRNSKD